MSTISTERRRELVATIRNRYRSASSLDKQRILDEFVALTGYHRKYAIRVLRSPMTAEQPPRPPRKRIYDEAVREALGMLWEASDRVCGKRLKPLLPSLVAALERHGHLTLEVAVRERLLAASAATIDRLLATRRAMVQGRRRGPPVRSAASESISGRSFADWEQPEPGHLEIGLVPHRGGTIAAGFVHTLVLTDVASGWTECIALLVLESSLVIDALDCVRTLMPFPLRGISTDSTSEFINETLLEYCSKQQIELTRSRRYRKSDQGWIEQKNGSIVRRLVGHGRLEGLRAAEGLGRLYTASRLFVNFFQPSFKLKEKTRMGARVTRRYHAPETPCAYLIACPTIDEQMKERLCSVLAALDPLRLLDEIRAVQYYLAGLAAGEVLYALPDRDAHLERALQSLAAAWKDGEVRLTHREGSNPAGHREQQKPARHWRTRKDPFESVWPRIIAWLESEPDATASELLQRLQSESPGSFADGLRRTLQRRVKEWRRLAARDLVFATTGPAMHT
jgi:hypothetical protein